VVSAAEEARADRLVEPVADRIAGRFAEARQHVPTETALAARRAAEEADADALLSIGGGSTTGAAKAIALTSSLPIVAVPTTYAGSEATPVWGITEGRRRTTGRDMRVLPRVVIYDPEVTLTLPERVTATSGLNALAHSVEAFWAPGANPITSLIAEESIRALADGLPAVLDAPRDVDARGELLYGAWLAGTAFAVAGSSLHHKVCHVLGGAYDLPHAETHAVMLPHTAGLAAPAVPGVEARIASALDAADQPVGQTLAALIRRLRVPTSLREIGLREDQLDDAAERVLEQVPSHPVALDRDGVRALLRAAFEGVVPTPTPMRT
jgi:maleylacetate reductase